MTAVASPRVPVHLAWRLIRRSPARSTLIALLVAIPVLAGTFALVTISTARLSPGEAATRYLGGGDAIAQVTEVKRFDPQGTAIGRGARFNGEPGTVESPVGRGHQDPVTVDLTALLPPGSHVTPGPDNQRPVRVRSGRRATDVTGVPVDLRDPATRGTFSIVRGTAPAAGQVAVTTSLAEHVGVSLGERLSVQGIGGSVTVAAILRDPRSLGAREVVAPLAEFGGMTSFHSGAYSDPSWLVTFPGHRAPDLHAALAAHGIIYETRHQWEFPAPELGSTTGLVNSQVVAVLGSIVLFGIAEIVLLAGTAFAVGTRRQVQQLGLLRAVGGDETEVRRTVLAQGLLLGAVGAVLGVVLGVVTVFFARPLLEDVADTAFGRLDGRPAPILAVALVGVVAGLLAAVVPARTSARMSVLDMLRSRFHVDAGAVRVPRWAWAALVVGPAVVVLSAYGWHHDLGGNGSAAVGSASIRDLAAVFTSSSSDGRWTVAISLGAAITLAGILRSCPALLDRLGRLAHRFPLSLRLATRDAARHRHRTAPAAAAVATVVAGAVLVLFVASSSDIRGRESYQPTTPIGTGWLSTGPRVSIDQALALVRQQIGIRAVGTQTNLTAPSERSPFSRLGAHFVGCPQQQDCLDESVAIGTPALVDIVAGRHVPGAAQTLASGGAVVLASGLAHAGRVQIDRVYGRRNPHYAGTSLTALAVPDLPAYAETPHVVVSAQTAAAHGWRRLGQSAIFVPAHLPSDADTQRVEAALGPAAALSFERGYHGHLGLVLLALIGAAAIATLAGTSIAVALAMAESRPDMATLAAVGASPSRRRVHAMAQAFTVGGLGSLLGLGLGSLVGIALLEGSTSYPFTLPFRWLALLVVTAPVLSVLVAGAVTRGRVDLTRRIA